MSTDSHVNDGTTFEVTVKDDGEVVDISSSTDKRLYFKKPDKTIANKVAGFKTDGTDGIISYSAVSGDLDQCGRWKVQGFVKLGSDMFQTSIGTFRVHSNLL